MHYKKKLANSHQFEITSNICNLQKEGYNKFRILFLFSCKKKNEITCFFLSHFWQMIFKMYVFEKDNKLVK